MFGTGSRFQVAKVRGIPIYASWSWVLLAAFFTFSWYTQFSVQMTSNDALLLAAITAVLFFGGILLHEAAHAVAARSFDLPVRAITLVFWAAPPDTRSWRAGPLADFVVAAAGPGTTAILGLGFLYVGSIMAPGDTREAIESLGRLNLYFAVLNAVPGFPLDGGRMLMAAAWAATKNRGTALRAAGVGSMVVGIGLIAYAVLSFSNGNGGFGIFIRVHRVRP
jgi:Zn-dependent protease